MPLNQPGRSGGLLPYLFLYIPVVWAALLIAQSLGDDLPELLMNLTAALQTPLKIHWTGHSLMSILACTGLYVMGICLYRTTQGRTRDGEEHGSAQWASPKQVNAMFCQKQNKPLTKHVRLGLDIIVLDFHLSHYAERKTVYCYYKKEAICFHDIFD